MLAVSAQPHAWWVFVPPIWFAAPFRLLQGEQGGGWIILSCLALLVPILFVAIYLRLLPSFQRQVEKLIHNGGGSHKKTFRLSVWFGERFIRNPQERAFYRFACAIMDREREFKLKVYPSLGFSIVIPFIGLLTQLQLTNWNWGSIPGAWSLTLYGTGALLPTILLFLPYSSRHGAAWIYEVSPVPEQGTFYRGAVLASLVKLFLPVFFGDRNYLSVPLPSADAARFGRHHPLSAAVQHH